MDRKQILNKIQEQLQEELKDSYVEGTLCYDLTVPYAYGVEEVTNAMEDMVNQVNPLKANEEILVQLAEPRIGAMKPESPPIFQITSEEEIQDYESWYLENTTLLFRLKEVFTPQKIIIQGESYYTFTRPIQVGMIFSATTDRTIQANLTQVISLGEKKESLEQYRQRYLQSFFVDQEVGLASYYISKISAYNGVGLAGVAYQESHVEHKVVVYITSEDYQTEVTANFCEEVQNYFTSEEHNIVPLFQDLAIRPITPLEITLTLQFQGQSLENIRDAIMDYLSQLNRDVYSVRVMNDLQLKSTLNFIELRDFLIVQFHDYGTLNIFLMNGDQEDILLFKQLPKWVLRNG